ncbi:hypothetical protein ACFYUD_14130 [Nocardia tengchongensis]|uniref:hypothetical protein n=1 Tax=Nocardia tengchongensis TaxID=2055889 RepID=UPI0036AFBD89
MCVEPAAGSVPLTTALAETLTFIALSGEQGISPDELREALNAPPRQRLITPGGVQHRVYELKKRTKLPIPDIRFEEAGGRYVLTPFCGGWVDAWEFITGVQGRGLTADLAEIDRLLALWRGNPIKGAKESEVSRWWQPVLAAHRRLVDVIAGLPQHQRGMLANLHPYADLFPRDVVLRQLVGGPSGKPRLLVVEDQVMDAIIELLEDEFDIVQARSYEKWREVVRGGGLRDVDAALVDRHLKLPNFDDNYGTIKVATHLMQYTRIPVTLMSVDVEFSADKQLEICNKYRLVNVVRKHENGALNRQGVLEAVRKMTDRGDRAIAWRLERWLASVVYQVEGAHLYARTSAKLFEDCRHESDRIRQLLSSGRVVEAEAEFDRFVHRFTDSPDTARS